MPILAMRRKKQEIKPSILLQLPTEIRLMVWEHVFGNQAIHLLYLPQDDGTWQWKSSFCVGDETAHKLGHRLGTYNKDLSKFVTSQLQCYGQTRTYWEQGTTTNVLEKSINAQVDLRALRTCHLLYLEAMPILYSQNTFICLHPWQFGVFIDGRTDRQKKYLQRFHFDLHLFGWQRRLNLWRSEFSLERLSQLDGVKQVHFHIGKPRRADTGANLLALIDHWRVIKAVKLEWENRENAVASLATEYQLLAENGHEDENEDENADPEPEQRQEQSMVIASNQDTKLHKTKHLEHYSPASYIGLMARDVLVQELLENGIEGRNAEGENNDIGLVYPVSKTEFALMRERYHLGYATSPPVKILPKSKTSLIDRMNQWRKQHGTSKRIAYQM